MVTRERMKEAEKGGEREAEGSRKPKKSALYVSLCSSTDVDTDIAVCKDPEKKSGRKYSKQKMQEAEEKLSCATVMTSWINMINC